MAENGFGKSSFTAAFRAAESGKMKLQKNEFRDGNEGYLPRLEIEVTKDRSTQIYVSDCQKGEISRAFSVLTISNPIYTKSTGKHMGGFTSRSAEILVHEVEVCDIVTKAEIPYKITQIRSYLGKNSNNFSPFFTSEEGLQFIVDNKTDIEKCIKHKRTEQAIEKYINTQQHVEIENNDILILLEDRIKNSFEGNSTDILLQIVYIVKEYGFDKISKSLEWIRFHSLETTLNERIMDFNTTGLSLKAAKRKGKLVISFGRADRMSNGERDVLFLLASLIKFEAQIKRKPGLLIIDEVFDYLDGSNLLAAQYYVVKLIETLKKSGKQAFIIIMTHLDPGVFNNYYFKKQTVHYLSNHGRINLEDPIVKLLVLRSQLPEGDIDRDNLEKYLLHYHVNNWEIPNCILCQLPAEFCTNSLQFRNEVYNEIKNKYLKEKEYNPLKVIVGIRQRIEELMCASLEEGKREAFFQTHKTDKKIEFVENCVCEQPEIYSLLKPLYNDPLHLGAGNENTKSNRNKINGAYLKLSSLAIRRMIAELFDEVGDPQ